MITEGVAYFAKTKFKNKDQCETWLKAFSEGDMKLDGRTPIDKTLYGIKAASAAPTSSEWQKIQALMTDPEQFKEENVAVYHPMLAHNVVDRDIERFDKSLVGDFARTLPDKPLLMGHEGSGGWSAPGEGRFFSAKVKSVSVDEMFDIISPHPNKNIKDQLKEIEEEDQGLVILETGLFLVKLVSNEDFRTKISAGIIKDVSIRFRASSREVVRDSDDPDSSIKYHVYRGPGEAIEGSFVYLGSQYGMQNRKALVPISGQPEEPAESGPKQTGEELMKLTFKSLGDIEFTETGLENVQKKVDEAVDVLNAEKTALQEKVDTLESEKTALQETVTEFETIKTVFGDDLDEEKAKTIKGEAEARKAELIDRAVVLMVKSGAIKNDPEIVDAKKSELDSMTAEVLAGKCEEYTNILKSSSSSGSQFSDGDEPTGKTFTVDVRNIR